MTRAERLAERIARSKTKIAKHRSKLEASLAEERQILVHAKNNQREITRQQDNKWRFHVGSLAAEAGLRAWSSADLTLTFQTLASLGDVSHAFAVLDAGLDTIDGGTCQGIRERISDLSSSWEVPYKGQELSPLRMDTRELGWVYVLQMQEHPLLKIGYTMNIDLRLRELQVGCPELLRVLRTYCCSQPQQIECEVHRRLAAYCRLGEWFETDLATVDQIIRDISTPVWELTQEIQTHE